MKVTWLVDKCIVKNTEQYERMAVGFSKNPQVDVVFTEYIPFSDAHPIHLEFPKDPCLIVYGTHEFVRQANRQYQAVPLSYCNEHNLHWSTYAPKIPKEIFLNFDYIMLPFAEFVRRKDTIFRDFDDASSLFIRPNSGFKTFAGHLIHKDEFEHEINGMRATSSVTDETICVIASPKNIKQECRFIIANREVVGGSTYRVNDATYLMPDVDERAKGLAQYVAKLKWQPDVCYTCDVAVTKGNEVKVIELNSFSCAGLYECDLEHVIKKVSEAALLDYKDELNWTVGDM